MVEEWCWKSFVLILLLLCGGGTALPLENTTSLIKNLILTAHVVEESSFPDVPLLWHFKDKSYYVATIVTMNFFEAEQFCSFHGMRLVSITSKEENIFLGQNVLEHGLTTSGDMFWTSGTKLPDNQHWVWLTTGSRVEFTSWGVGEPNDVGTLEKCLEVNNLRTPKTPELLWNDRNCASKLFFICEYKKPKTISYVIDKLKELVNSTNIEIPSV